MKSDNGDANRINPSTFSVIGFLLSEIGLGHAARNLAHAIRHENLPLDLVNIYLKDKSNDLEFASECSSYRPGNTNIVVAGLGDAGILHQEISKSGLGRKNYIYLSWELDRLPYSSYDQLRAFDGVIAPSTFLANAVSNFLGTKTKTLLQPVKIPTTPPLNSIRDGKLRIFSSMDFDSFPSRKNPQGVLDVFAAAFPSNQFNDVELLLKVRGVNDKGSREVMQSYAARDKRIKIIDQTLGRNEMDTLINASNVYLSMHRSEGFGFGPAEALASEKIVVSTDYGGTCDFVNSDTGYPISYRLVPVKPFEYPSWENQLWAEPSVESAAQSLRDIYDHYEDAQERAKNGRRLMIQQHSFAAAGKVFSSLFGD